MSDELKKSRRIHLAHGDGKQREIIAAILRALDHEVALVTDSGEALIQAGVTSPPDLVVATPRLSDMDGIEALIRLGERRPVAGIVIARTDDLDKVERAMEDHIMAYLVEPVTADALQPAIYLAERRFQHFQQLNRKIDTLETNLANRRLIEQAKGIVMDAKQMREAEAHRFLQAEAMKKRKRLVDLAESICEAGAVLND